MCRVLLLGQEEKKEEDCDTVTVAVANSGISKDETPDKLKQEKLEIVLAKIEEHCLGLSSADSSNTNPEVKEFQTIRAALLEADKNGKKNNKLIGKVLSGGYTNYSYKIFLDGNPSCCLFAKACFSKALWSSSHYYDLDRQNTEFQLMEHFGKVLRHHSGGGRAPIATPYLLLDVYKDNENSNSNSKSKKESNKETQQQDELDMRIIVTEWSSWADEQWANQFIEGQVDKRLIAPIAETMAFINLTQDTTFDRGINNGMRDGLNNMMAEFDNQVIDLFKASADNVNGKTSDDCLVELQRLGQEKVLAIMAAMRVADKQMDVLSHADTHVFNWLVEKKPLQQQAATSASSSDPQEDLTVFGPNGSFCLVDFEMSHWTAKGRDIGLLYSFPISAAYFHAAKGHTDQAMDILDCLREHWEVYSNSLRTKGDKSEQYLAETFRSGLGFCGVFLFLVHYCTGNQVELLDRDGLSEDEVCRVLGLIGKTGLHFLEWAFCDDVDQAKMDLKDLRALFDETVEGDIALLSASRRGQGRRPSRRRSSGLRAMDRRVSDASLLSLPDYQHKPEFV